MFSIRKKISFVSVIYSVIYILIFFYGQLTFGNQNNNCPTFPYFQPHDGPLAAINGAFHHAYEQRIKAMLATFGSKHGRPIILALGGHMLFKYNDKTETADITPLAYHQLKAFAHAPFTIYLLLSESTSPLLTQPLKMNLNKLQLELKQATGTITALKLPQTSRQPVISIAKQTNALIETILKNKTWTKQTLETYFVDVRPHIQNTIAAASAIELSSLHRTVTRWLQQLNPNDRKKLAVVIAASHQARAKEISLQYFKRKLGFKYDVGALAEKNFVVIEDKFDEQSALNLLARHYLDREAARTIFNDEMRLQRDLLSDAGAHYLALKMKP